MTAAQILAQKQDHYRFKPVNAAAATEHTIEIFNEIGEWWGYGLMALSYDLHGRSEDVRVRLNSPGGDYTQGIAIRAFLENYPGKVTVEVMGLAASSATILATGADVVQMHAGALYMIHNPATWGGGTADQLSQEVETLRKIESDMAALYLAGIKKRDKMNGKSDEDMTAQIKAWMTAETWFTAKEAVDLGFADEIIGADEQATTSAITAQLSTQIFAHYKNAPQRVVNLATTMADKNKPGLLDRIKALLAGEEAEETTETTETTDTADATDPIQAAKDLLAENGYNVTETETQESEEQTEPDVTAKAKTYTEDEIENMITAALEKQAGTKAAGQSVTAKAAASASIQISKADAIKASVAKKLAPLAKALQN